MQKLNIKDWAEADRPREKLMQLGVKSLSNSELLAILIGSGSKEETVVELAQRILAKSDNNLNKLGQATVKELIQGFKGIGEAKAITIVAALELGKRRQQAEALQIPKIKSSIDAYHILYPLLSDLPHEEVWALLLNKNLGVISTFQVCKGGIDSSFVDIRLLMKEALNVRAVSFILAHNHPSGQLSVSLQDKETTHKVQQAAKLLDMLLVDHIIIAHNNYISFKDEGLL